MCGDDAQGQEMWDTLWDRFIAYGQIVIEKRGDAASLWGCGMKLSEYCEIRNGLLFFLVPELFKTASELVSVFRA